MVSNYFLSAWRNIVRHKTWSWLNIAGLVVSLTAFILMALYVENELSFDKFHVNAANIYRVEDQKKTPDLLQQSAQTAAPVAPALLHEFPVIQQAVRLMHVESLIKYNNKLFEERNIYFADPSIFKVFSFNLINGNPENALNNPGNIVLTAKTASKYFGKENAVGKIITVDNENMQVTGVVNDVPANSHLQFDFIISMATAEKKGSGSDWLFTNWYSNQFYTYVLLPDHYDISKLTAQMSAFDARHKEKNGVTTHAYAFEKLSGIYLHATRPDQAGKTGSMANLYIFSIVGIFILLLACINFINLSTARAATRAKEVAIKKVAGAARSHVMKQFLTESSLITAVALALALVCCYALLPAFNIFSGKSLSLQIGSTLHIVSIFILFASISFLSGLYPAIVLSGFQPVTALKGKTSPSAWSIVTRKGLVVFQFTVSVILIVCSIVVYSQMNYLQNHDLGFKPTQTMVINFEGDEHVKQRMASIKEQILSIPGVKNIAASSNVPGDGNTGSWSMDMVKKTGDTIHTELPVYCTDFNYLKQYEIPVVAGRALSLDYATDSTESMLINETALKQLGFANANDAIGVKVGMYPTDAKIVGIVKDFHYESLQKALGPLAIRVIPFKLRMFSIQLNGANIKQTVQAIESKWQMLVPERPLEYSFLDDSFNQQYQSEIKFGQVFGIFTLVAIVIACLGLFGLVLVSIQQRIKEIGVRKVLGATVAGITVTLSKDFLKLVGIAIIIASPAAYFVMHQWLQNFSYQVTIGVGVFLMAGCMAISIAIITISFQTIKAALMNPAKSLRTE